MGVVFTVGTVLGRNDLKIFLRNSSGVSVNAYSITFGIYYVDPDTEEEVAVGSESKAPINPAVGEYYAAIIIPSSAVPGDYRIRWTLKELSTSPEQMVMQEFGVVAEGVVTGSNYSSCEQSLIKSVRTLTRDNNPDRNYHFRPPEHASTVGCYNQVFGYIWEDEEILEYLNLALMKWNSHPPETEYLDSLNRLCSMKPAWKAAIVWGAVANAAIALSFNWSADEFSYSIGGISLDIERSSKYEGLYSQAEAQWDKLVESKSRTTKYITGIRQPKFGIGVRSAFGPNTGRGILSPRSYR